MSKIDPILTKMREICLSLPDTKETLTWGQPHFRVGDKICSSYRLIAPKKSLAKIGDGARAPSPGRPRTAKTASVKALSPKRRTNVRKKARK